MKMKFLLACIFFTCSFCAVAEAENSGNISSSFNIDENKYSQTNQLQLKGFNEEKTRLTEDKAENRDARESGRFLMFGASALTGIDEGSSILNHGYTVVSGIRFKGGIKIGLGSGIESFGESVIPFFGYLSFPLAKGFLPPFIYLKGGYGVAFLREAPSSQWDDPGSKGGALLGAGGSITIFSWGGAALNVGVGYRFQKLIGRKHGPWQMQRIVDFNRIDLQLTLSFW